jgi:putative spermidine/putrescine transport system substrate-binding protein
MNRSQGVVRQFRGPGLVLGALTLLAAMFVAGCGGGGSSSSEPVKTTASGDLDLSGQTISYLGFGGSLDEAMQKEWFEPFEEATGAKVVISSPTDYKKVETQVESGNVTYDIVDGDPYVIDPGCGTTWQPLTTDLGKVEPQYRPESKCGVPDYVYGYTIASDSEAFPDGGPQTCPEFFDTEKFPGKRGVWSYYVSGILECAAISAGADPKDPYPLDIDKAFAELEKIKDDLVIYDTEAQAADDMLNGDFATGIVTPRMLFEAEGSSFVPSSKWGVRAFGTFGIPKGAPHAAAAQELLDFLIEPELNRKMTYNNVPVYGSPTGGPTNPTVPPDLSPIKPSSKEFAAIAMDVDWKWWAENDPTVSGKWINYATG